MSRDYYVHYCTTMCTTALLTCYGAGHGCKISDIFTNKTNSVAFSPQANYTDWATATGRRILVPTFADRVVSHCQRGGSHTVVNLSVLERNRYSFVQVAPQLCSRGWVDPVSNPLLLRNRTRDLWVSSEELWPIDHRGGLTALYLLKLTLTEDIMTKGWPEPVD
jgi:hypothetical protein